MYLYIMFNEEIMSIGNILTRKIAFETYSDCLRISNTSPKTPLYHY